MSLGVGSGIRTVSLISKVHQQWKFYTRKFNVCHTYTILEAVTCIDPPDTHHSLPSARHEPALPFVQAMPEKDMSNPDTNLSSSQAKRENRKKFTAVVTVKVITFFFVPKQPVSVLE